MNRKSKTIIGGVSVLALVAIIAVSVQNGAMRGLNGRDLTNIAPAAGEKTYTEHSFEDVPDTDVPYTIERHEELTDENVEESGDHGHSDDHGHDHGEFFDWDYAPPEPTECGVYEEWIANPVDVEAIKETGKVYRIIGLGDAVTEDHNPERINVYINQNDIVLDVKCG